MKITHNGELTTVERVLSAHAIALARLQTQIENLHKQVIQLKRHGHGWPDSYD